MQVPIKLFTENINWSRKNFIFNLINGLGSNDVRLSKRKKLSSRRMRGFEKGKIGPKMELIMLEEIMLQL